VHARTLYCKLNSREMTNDFYRAAWNADAEIRIPSVCPSVAVPPSVERVYYDKTEKKICPDFYTIRKII